MTPDKSAAAPDLGRAAAALREASVRAPRRSRPLLDHVSLTIEAGERLLVIGPSGSGKSSLLQVFTGVIPFSQNLELEGVVQLAGVDMTERSVIERSRHLGVVAQDPSAAVCMARVDQEVALPLENHGVPRCEISDRVDEALAGADAAGLQQRSTAQLSGGEAQRVALAAALAPRPALVLLDEPTSMLDPAGVRAVRRSIDSMVATRSAAVVLVEHRLDEFAGADGASGLPERAFVLGEGGRMLAYGETVTVLRENAARLHDAGCWLPLETELLAVTGQVGGLTSPAVRSWLLEAASAGVETAVSEHPVVSEEKVLLRATSLAVGYREPAASWRRRPVRPIVSGVDLALRAGETVALLGANGSGKSTLLLSLAGLLPTAAGSLVGPRPSMVFQNPERQFVAHRVRDEIAAGLPGTPAEVAAVVEKRLDVHRLEHVANENPYRLSGGEKRRLSLAAMLAHADRPVLLADEPAFGLDRRETTAVAEVFRSEAEFGRALLFSSHDVRFVAAVADRVLVLAEGQLIADGPVGVVFRDSAALRRAGLELPPLVAWLLAERGGGGARRALRHLDAARSTVAEVTL